MKRLIAFLLVTVMLFGFSGCSKDPDTTTTAGGSQAESSSSTSEEKVVKLALSIPVAAAPYWTAVGYGVQKAMDEINAEAGSTIVEYQFFDPGNFELESQLKNIEDALALKFDGMVIAPVDANGTVNAIKKAFEEGVPMVTVDLSANTDVLLAGYCTYNYNAGCTNAEKMAELINEKNGAYKGKVVMNMGKANISSHIARCQGFKDTMAEKYPDIEIIFEQFADNSEENVKIIENALAMFGNEIDAVFATGDTAADMACQAIDSSGLFKEIGDPDHIIVVGFDAEINGINNIRAGRQDATVAQNPILMGQMAAIALYEYIVNGSTPSTDADGLVEVPHFAIDYKNIETPEAQEFFWAIEVESVDIDL